MSINASTEAYCQVCPEEAKAELERLLSDQRFHGTDRAKRILRYIVERCLEGEQHGVKAYAIALDVLNRPEHFDTNSDPIVRIEISRLRSALSNYYEAYGSDLNFKLHLPVGRYLASFTRSNSDRTAVMAPDACDVEPLPKKTAKSAMRFQSFNHISTRVRGLLAATLALLITGTAAAAYLSVSPKSSERPHVFIKMSSADSEHGEDADVMKRFLIAVLSKFRTVDIVTRPATIPAAGAAYEIEIRYYGDDDGMSIWWQVVDGNDGGILRSGVDQAKKNGRSEAAIHSELVSTLARRFASSRGIIGNLQAHDAALSRALGNACVLRGEYALDEGSKLSIAAAAPCLVKTLAHEPRNADALAVLSQVLVASTGGDPASTDFAEATALASEAASIDPSSDRAFVALMMAHFYAGRTDAAIASGKKALALNPDNPDVQAKFAQVLYSSGFTKAGVSLAEDASRNIEAVPREASVILALETYRNGDWSNASLVSEQANDSDFVVRAIRAAAAAEMGSSSASQGLVYLKSLLPDYQTSFATLMERRRYPADVIASLQVGLKKAEHAGLQASR